MFKHMLYGIVVMTASYVHSMEKPSKEPTIDISRNVCQYCISRHFLGDSLPMPGGKWKCLTPFYPFYFRDFNVKEQSPSWKDLTLDSYHD